MKRIKTNLFDITTVKREPFGGALLVAGPFLEESYFNHGVVSLVSYSQAKMMLLTGSKEESTLNFYRNAGYNSSDKTAFIQWIDM